MKIYLASGWFNPTQAAELDRLEEIFDNRASFFDLASPRRIFVCPPDAPQSVQEREQPAAADAEGLRLLQPIYEQTISLYAVAKELGSIGYGAR